MQNDPGMIKGQDVFVSVFVFIFLSLSFFSAIEKFAFLLLERLKLFPKALLDFICGLSQLA